MGTDYACSNSSFWNSGQKSFADPVPSGGVVVGVVVRVYGRLTTGVSTLNIPIDLNGFRLGSYNAYRQSCNGTCDPLQPVSFNDSNGVPGYVYGGTNVLRLQTPTGTTSTSYCASHAELVLTVAEPRIQVSPVVLSFGNQKLGTTSAAQVVRVTNSGDALLRIDTVSITPPFLVSSPPTPLSIAPGAGYDFLVSFSPTVVGQATGTLTLKSNDSTNPQALVSLAGTGAAAVADVSPTTIDFGEQRVNISSAPRTVTVRNAGSSPLTVSTVSINGPFSVDLPNPFTLAPNETKALAVVFFPNVEGMATGTLTLQTDAPDRPTVVVNMTGVGVKPTMVLSPSTVDFGAQRVGTSAVKTVVVTNTGSGTLLVSSVSTTSSFAVSPTSAFSLAPSQSITLTVAFTPTVLGNISGTLTLNTNDAARPTVNVALSGSGVRPNLVVDPSPLAFGDVRVNTDVTKTVTVRNTGTGPITFTSISKSGSASFSLVNAPAGSFTLAAGANMVLSVKYNPTTETLEAGVLTLTSADADFTSVTVNLSGRGVRPNLVLSPTSLAFGEQAVGTTSTPMVVSVRNTGSGTARITALSISGPFALSPTTSFDLEAGGIRDLTVTFRPTAEGQVSGTLTLNTDDSARPIITVALSGSGGKPVLALSSTALAFGAQPVGTTSAAKTVTVSNTGTSTLRITSIAISGTAFAVSSVSAFDLTPGTSKALSVTFSPTAQGAFTGTLTLTSNDPAMSTATVSLSGTGVDGMASVTPSTVAFGSVEVGTSGTQQVAALTNTGDYPLTIAQVVQPVETSFSVYGLTPGLVLNPGEQRSFAVTFAPTRRGFVTDTLVIKTDARLNPTYNLSVSGTGIAPAVELQPKDIHFGKLNVGVTARQFIAIKNVGERDLYVSNLSFVDVAAGAQGAALDFAFEAVMPLVVKPGESTSVPLTFTPREVGLRQARVIVYTNDKVAEANVMGEGTSSNLVVAPTALDFSAVLVSSAPVSKVVRLTNTGNGPLTLNSVTLSGVDTTAFFLTMPVLPLSLQPGASRELMVAFRPETVRSFSAQLVVESNDANAPIVAVPLSGSGVGHQIALSPSPVEFGQQLVGFRSSPRKVRVTNSGGFNATLTSLTVLGAGASQFSTEGLSLPLVLAPGQSQEVGVALTPQAEGEVNCTLKLGFAEFPSQPEVGLRGRGIAKAFSVQPSPLDFGTVRAGGSKREQLLTFTNLSSETIVLAAAETRSSTGEAFLFEGAALAGRTIPPNESIIVPVGYQPTVETLSEATLSFGTTTPAQPRAVDVQLKGKATLRLLSADPGSLDFGRVDVVGPAESKVVTVTNKSSQPQRVVVMLKAEGTPFTLDTSALANAIPAGGSATFKVTFQPQTVGDAENEVGVWLQGETEPEALIPVKGIGRRLESLPGGCSCGSTEAGSAGMLALLALAGLGSRRRRRA